MSEPMATVMTHCIVFILLQVLYLSYLQVLLFDSARKLTFCQENETLSIVQTVTVFFLICKNYTLRLKYFIDTAPRILNESWFYEI